MDKSIDTLVEDIYGLFGSGETLDQYVASKWGEHLGETISKRVPKEPSDGYLRMSNVGTPCKRKLWYHCSQPYEDAIPLPKTTLFKFLYGDILEEVVLYLALCAGHKVSGVQDECEIAGIKGHRDAVIDGVLVDVKSASSYSFDKFSNHLELKDDSFGYITQLQLYLHAAQDDPVVTEKDRAAFLVVDKTLGKICLDIHTKDNTDYEKKVEDLKFDLSIPAPPSRGFEPEEDGKSGNMKLGTVCSYCDWKKVCHPGLKAFAYSGGPRYLTQVVKQPKNTSGPIKEIPV